MTKNKIFTFLMLSILGGFVLSTPCSALAADDSDLATKKMRATNIRDDVLKEFIMTKEVGVYKEDVNKTGDWSTLSQKAKSAMDSTEKAYEAEKEAFIDFCEAWYEGFWRTVGEKITKLVTHDYAYTFEANMIIEDCTGLNEDNDKAKAMKARIPTFIELAQKAEDAAVEYDTLTELGEGDLYEYIEKDDEGNIKARIVFMINTDGGDTITTVQGVTQGCTPLPFKLYEAKSCLFCPLFETIYGAIDRASARAYAETARPLSNILLIGLAIWIALMVLTNVSSLTKQDAPQFLNNLFKASFKVVIAFLLLRHSGVIYGMILGPLLKAGFEFGTSFLSLTGEGSLNSLSSCKTYMDSIAENGVASSIFPKYVYANLLCFIEAVQKELATSQAIGSSLMCVAHNKSLSNLGPIAAAIPDFSMLLQGALIYIVSLILSLAFAFYLIDATISLGIFGVLLPFFIMCWPFKITNGYAKKGFEVFVNSLFIYVFMGIVVNITLQLIGQGLTGTKGGFDAVMNAINGNEVKNLQSLLDIGFSGFLVLVACCIFGIKLMMQVQSLAGKFAGGGLGLGIGNQVGGLAAASATGAAKSTLSWSKERASNIYNAKVWGETDKDGNPTGRYRSMADGVNNLKARAGRKVAGKLQKVGHSVGHALASLMSGKKRRNS